MAFSILVECLLIGTGLHKITTELPTMQNKLLVIVLLLCTAFAEPKNCKKYFSGKWKYNDLSASTIYVVRTKKKQFEYTEDGKYYFEYNIKWLSACKYQMTYIKTNSPTPAIAQPGETLVVDIVDIQQNTMQYKTTFRDKQEIGSMTKIPV